MILSVELFGWNCSLFLPRKATAQLVWMLAQAARPPSLSSPLPALSALSFGNLIVVFFEILFLSLASGVYDKDLCRRLLQEHNSVRIRTHSNSGNHVPPFREQTRFQSSKRGNIRGLTFKGQLLTRFWLPERVSHPAPGSQL